MNTKEKIINILFNYDCLTCQEIKGFIYRKFGDIISPQTIAGQLRPLIACGYAAKSPNSNNKMVYWLNDYGKIKLKDKKEDNNEYPD